MATKNTIIVGMHEAKSQLSRLVREVQDGAEVIVTNAGRPVARLVEYGKPAPRRKPGFWKGQVVIHEGFDDPEERLYLLLAEDEPDSAHSRYNALVRRLVSFERAAECAQ